MKTQLFSVRSPSDPAIAKVGAILRNGGLAAIPTETVYGLAANALNDDAVRGIFRAKGRPADNPLIVHISDLSQWDALVTAIPDHAKRLAAAYWPGPLTIILPKSDRVSNVVSGGLATVAVRMPSHPIARAVIDAAGVPLAAPSANTSGKPSPTAAQHVIDDLDGRIDCIVDAGPCPIGVESTVVSLAGEKPRLLRPGGVTPEMLEAVLGEIEIDDAVFHHLADDQAAASPGMKYKHYAPAAKVTILKGSFAQFKAYVDAHKAPGTMALCFAGEEDKLSVPAIAFGSADDGKAQAARIFAALRELDERGAKTVFARFPQMAGVGLAVFNRLVRAAAFQIVDPEKRGLRCYGLTGKTGAGKSTVASLLRDRGWYVIDGDVLARQVVTPGSSVLRQLAAAFGGDILREDGTLDRKRLVDRLQQTPHGVETLNAITHPAIDALVQAELEKAREAGYTRCVFDAAALLESPSKARCDKIIVVTAPEDVRLERILSRDKLSEAQARARMAMQKDDDWYLSQADIVLRNYPPYSLEQELTEQVTACEDEDEN